MGVDMFLKIDGIQGESTDASHVDEIEIFSYTWAESQPAAASGGCRWRTRRRVAPRQVQRWGRGRAVRRRRQPGS